MQDNTKNTFYNLKLLDGRTVKVTLNFARLYKLRAKNKAVYEKYIQSKNALQKKNIDDFDLIYIIYTAFLCANEDETISFDEFLEIYPNDEYVTGQLLLDLIAPSKKKEVFQQHSKKRHRN